MSLSEIIMKMVRKLCRPGMKRLTLFHILLFLPFKVKDVLPCKVWVFNIFFLYLIFIIITVVRPLVELEVSPELIAGSPFTSGK